MRKRWIAAAVAAVMALGSAVTAAAHERELRRGFAPGEIDRLEIDNLAGRLLLEGKEEGGLELLATVHSRASGDLSAELVSRLLDLQIAREGGHLRVEARYPLDEFRHYRYGEGGGFFSRSSAEFRVDRRKVRISTGGRGGGLPLWVDIHVRVPAGVDCALRHRVGGVILEGLHGDARVDCGSADVSVRDHAGGLEIDSGGGDVAVEKAAGKRLAVDTGSGDVRLDALDVPELAVDTGSGDVEIEAASRRIDTWRVDTGSGDVALVLPAGGSFRLEIDPGSGQVDCALDGGDLRIERGELRGLTVGGGEGRIRVDCGSGDIRIRERR